MKADDQNQFRVPVFGAAGKQVGERMMTIGEVASRYGAAQPPQKDMRDADAPWYVVRRLGGSDNHALDWLERMKLTVYYPQVREMKALPRRMLSKRQRAEGAVIMRPIVTPFFPGYFFTRIDFARTDWRKLSELAGVGGLVCADNLPVRIPDALIAAIRAREVGGVVPGGTPAALIFDLKQAVRVNQGAFAGFSAVVEKLPEVAIEAIDSETRIRVAIDLFGRPTPFDLPVGYLDKV